MTRRIKIAIVAPGSRLDAGDRRSRDRARAQRAFRRVELISIRSASGRRAISPAPTRSAPTPSSKPPTTQRSMRSGSARGGYGAGRVAERALRRLNDVRGAEDLSRLQRCRRAPGRALHARVSSASPTGRCRPTSTARAARRRCARALAYLVDRRDPRRWSRGRRRRKRRGAFNITILQPADRHAVPARPRRPCADARGGVGVHVPDRPVAVPHHQQPADPRRRRHPARPLQRHPATTIRISARPKRRSSQHWCDKRRHPLSRPRRYRPRRRQQGRAVRWLALGLVLVVDAQRVQQGQPARQGHAGRHHHLRQQSSTPGSRRRPSVPARAPGRGACPATCVALKRARVTSVSASTGFCL